MKKEIKLKFKKNSGLGTPLFFPQQFTLKLHLLFEILLANEQKEDDE